MWIGTIEDAANDGPLDFILFVDAQGFNAHPTSVRYGPLPVRRPGKTIPI